MGPSSFPYMIPFLFLLLFTALYLWIEWLASRKDPPGGCC
jgi:hypothetical protein